MMQKGDFGRYFQFELCEAKRNYYISCNVSALRYQCSLFYEEAVSFLPKQEGSCNKESVDEREQNKRVVEKDNGMEHSLDLNLEGKNSESNYFCEESGGKAAFMFVVYILKTMMDE